MTVSLANRDNFNCTKDKMKVSDKAVTQFQNRWIQLENLFNLINSKTFSENPSSHHFFSIIKTFKTKKVKFNREMKSKFLIILAFHKNKDFSNFE
jgi:hypothetical protein